MLSRSESLWSYFVDIGIDRMLQSNFELVIRYSRGSLPPDWEEHEKFMTDVNFKM